MEQLLEKIRTREFVLSVMGIGHVGLPLALVFADAGLKVYGIDISPEHVAKIKSGEQPFYERNMEQYLKRTLSEGRFYPTTDTSCIQESHGTIITVGTPLSHNYQPDLSQLNQVLAMLTEYDLTGKLIILRSTAAPLTFHELVKPYLERKTGLKDGKNLFLAICPERILQGNAIDEIRFLPEMIGVDNDAGFQVVSELFRLLEPSKATFKMSPLEAELAKLFSNVYRYVQFALANEFGLISENLGADAFRIIKIANKDYPRNNIPLPGLAGGPCLTKDGYFLTQGMLFPDFIHMAWRVNEFLPNYIVDRLKATVQDRGLKFYEMTIGVLGITFKAGSDDVRLSPSKKLANLLIDLGIEVLIHDPHLPDTESLETVLENCSIVILAMNHPQFHGIALKIDRSPKIKIFFDCWGMFDPNEFKNVQYIGFGRP